MVSTGHEGVSLKSRAAWLLVVRPRLKKWFKKSPEGREAEKTMREFLAGKKEIITHIVGLVIMLATTFGWVDFVGPLNRLSEAIAAGDPVAVLGALFGIVMSVAAIFKKMGVNRRHEELVKVEKATTTAVKQS